jgi:hypothetical protein
MLAGDMLRAEVPTGKKAENHVGRVAVRGSGSFESGQCRRNQGQVLQNFSIARTAIAMPGNPRFLPVLKNGV